MRRRTVITLLLALGVLAHPAVRVALCQDATSTDCPLGNNGVGNGIDPQPPGDPPLNDPDGTAPSDPDAEGGQEPSDDTGKPEVIPPNGSGTCVQVPEPATWIMVTTMCGMIAIRRQRGAQAP